MTPPRSLGPFLSLFGLAGVVLYAWVRYFLPQSALAPFVGILSLIFLTGGLFFFIGTQISRRWRTPARLLRWNAILSTLGIGNFLLWAFLSLLLPPEMERSYALITALAEIGITLQVSGHLALTGHLIGIRSRPEKTIAIGLYFALMSLVLLLNTAFPTAAAFLAPLLWVGILPLLYFSEWLQEVASRQIPEALIFLGGALGILFLEWEVLPPLFFSPSPPLLRIIHSLLVALIFLHGGWVVVPLLLRLLRLSRGEQDILELMTEFLKQQQRSTSAQDILEISSQTFQKLPAVGGVLLILRSSPEESRQVSSISDPNLYHALRKKFFQVSGTEAFVEVVSSLQKENKSLPDLSAIFIQRPLVRLSGALLNQTLSVAAVSEKSDGFEEKDIQLITTLAEQTALFLENLERRQYQEQLLTARKESDFLRETREALMPPPPPILKRVDFHVHFEQYDRTIGGDYYQIYEYAEGDVVDFWLSDSAGSGIAAAYQMAQARAALNTLWLQKLPAEELILRLNDALKRVFHKNNFLAATLLRFDFLKREYLLMRAGTPEIFYWDPLTDTADILRPPGIVLGNASSQTIRRILVPERGELHPGSLFMLFSDGLSEASNLAGEMFGTDRLFSLFKAHVHATPKEIAQAIMSALHEFTGGTSLGDDGTLLVVRYLG
ncbi:MAG: PP2C family protein-serine/threonine phosphatase [Bacteroidia bacterium]|nr:PP2C family protein-serine/threonine phosphatase [Bacteroidia bacterium]